MQFFNFFNDWILWNIEVEIALHHIFKTQYSRGGSKIAIVIESHIIISMAIVTVIAVLIAYFFIAIFLFVTGICSTLGTLPSWIRKLVGQTFYWYQPIAAGDKMFPNQTDASSSFYSKSINPQQGITLQQASTKQIANFGTNGVQRVVKCFITEQWQIYWWLRLNLSFLGSLGWVMLHV